MTKPNYTHIEFLIDRSGSMSGMVDSVCNGFNKLVNEQREIPGQATLTLRLFDKWSDSWSPLLGRDMLQSGRAPIPETIYAMMAIREVPALTPALYQPRGDTPLLDAVGRTIVTLGQRLELMHESTRPSKVVLVITTDGLENASTEYSYDDVRKLIDRQQRDYNWDVVFLGATLDSVKEAQRMGISGQSTSVYNSTIYGTQSSYGVVSGAIGSARVGKRAAVAFTDEEREKLEKTK
jgi:hypothetical protein